MISTGTRCTGSIRTGRKNGRLAMMDTMGQAAAMTGGYGSSYAQSAGQQAYQKQMDTLTDQAAQLYDRARQDYDRQGQMDRDRYDILRQRENSSYNQYKQGLSSWETENQRLWDRYDSLRQQEYQAQRDLIQDQQWQAEFDESVRRYNHDKGIGSSGSSGKGSSGSGKGGYSDESKQRQQMLVAAGYDVPINGYWDTKTDKAWTEYVGQLDVPTTTYARVANAAAAMVRNGESKTAISKYLNRALARDNYRPTLSVKEDLEALRSAFVGSGR